MATINLLLATIFILFSISPSLSVAKLSFQPRAFILPVTKDQSSGQYITQISHRTPLVTVNLTVDLGGKSVWVNCTEDNFVSSTYLPINCKSSAECFCFYCDGPQGVGCHNLTCRVVAHNPLRDNTHIFNAEIYKDVFFIPSTNGATPGRVARLEKFQFGCVDRNRMFDDLASRSQGIAGLGKDSLGLPSQLAKAYKFPPKFAICLSSSTQSSGVIFIGDGPYVFLPNIDVSKSLVYTPLLNKTVVWSMLYRGTPRTEYYVGVKSININGKKVAINTTMLAIENDSGIGGTQISTVQPYTSLETSIFKAVTKAFANELKDVPQVSPSKPFGLCYNAKSLKSTRLGPGVPD